MIANQKLYILTNVDVRRVEQPETTRLLTIAKLTIPTLKFMTANHHPGGGLMSIDYSLPQLEPIEASFQVKGIDSDVLGTMGEFDKWLFAGSILERQTNKDIPARAIIQGIVTDWEPDEFSPNEFLGSTHTIKNITHYEFHIGNKEIWYVDQNEMVLRRNGQDRYETIRRSLGIA